MRLRFFTFFMGVAAVLSVIAWLITLFNIDPSISGWMGISLFFATLTLAFLGIFFFFEYCARNALARKQMLFDRLTSSLRHSIFFTALVLIWAVMQSLRLARWWNLLLLVLILAALEFFFVSHDRRPHDHTELN